MESPRKGSSTSPLIVPIRVAGSASASVFSSSDEAPNAPSNAPTHESRPDEQGRDGNERNIKPGSRRPSSHLPSPLLTPTDPRSPADAIPDTAIGSNGVPTPDPSGDSHSDAEASSDSTNPPTATALPELEPPKEVALPAKTRSRSNTKTSNHDGKRRLSASKIQELTAAPESLPVASAPDRTSSPASAPLAQTAQQSMETLQAAQLGMSLVDTTEFPSFATANPPRAIHPSRPSIAARTVSTPLTSRRRSTGQSANATGGRRNSFQPVPRPIPLDLEGKSNFMPPPPPKPVTVVPPRKDLSEPVPPSPMLQSIPLPPMSIPTLLNLELAGQRPSPLYIHHSYASDLPYESSAVKFERLKNFLILPLYLERTIIFGALSCLDAWLWTFTILPLRFCVALSVLVRWWAYMFWKEVCWLVGFVWYGLGRMWSRGFRRGRGRDGNTNSREGDETSRSRSRSRVREVSGDNVAHAIATGVDTHPERLGDGLRSATVSKKSSSTGASSASRAGYRRHRRTKSHPSNLTSFNKADLLQGSLIIFTSLALMDLDASRMYHLVRAQSAIKLVAIYGLLEVSDRLLSALGQDILECLLSSETLSRDPRSGRSKVMLPLGMFLLALVYNVLHTVVLFYQVISLNVAVNSYSNNALLTLLLSNQFVEIKSTVFKRFEKENNFQLACADIVERFQLCIMLLIIGLRNIVEVGGLSLTGEGGGSGVFVGAGVIPASFKLLPDWLGGSGEVLSPFLVVLGSEVVVDCIKHAFVGKFNGLKAGFFGKVLDILCKDYYTGAFVTPALTRRLGLPVLPLSCLFIRASVQIYNNFLATHLPTPLPPSTQTSLVVEAAAETSSPAMIAALDRLDFLIRNALGRAIYGTQLIEGDNMAEGAEAVANVTSGTGFASAAWHRISSYCHWTSDDAIAALTMIIVFLLLFLILLMVKLLLGMVLLRYARDRYAKMKAKEHAVATGKQEREGFDLIGGKRIGGYGAVEVGEERRRWLFSGGPEDQAALEKLRERERKAEAGREKGKEKSFEGVMRYEMVAKRIW